MFQDLEYMRFFQETIRFSKVLRMLSGLAVFIACLGLLGLVVFIIERRNKEIGIRKVLGASAANIWFLLSGELGKLLLAGFVIAAPLSWYLMSKWLEDYDVRTDVSISTLFVAGGLMLLIALVTTSYLTLKASQINPVDYLKEE